MACEQLRCCWLQIMVCRRLCQQLMRRGSELRLPLTHSRTLAVSGRRLRVVGWSPPPWWSCVRHGGGGPLHCAQWPPTVCIVTSCSSRSPKHGPSRQQVPQPNVLSAPMCATAAQQASYEPAPTRALCRIMCLPCPVAVRLSRRCYSGPAWSRVAACVRQLRNEPGAGLGSAPN